MATRHRVYSRSTVACFWSVTPLLVLLQAAALYFGYLLFSTYAPFYFRFVDDRQSSYGGFGGPFQ